MSEKTQLKEIYLIKNTLSLGVCWQVMGVMKSVSKHTLTRQGKVLLICKKQATTDHLISNMVEFRSKPLKSLRKRTLNENQLHETQITWRLNVSMVDFFLWKFENSRYSILIVALQNWYLIKNMSGIALRTQSSNVWGQGKIIAQEREHLSFFCLFVLVGPSVDGMMPTPRGEGWSL